MTQHCFKVCFFNPYFFLDKNKGNWLLNSVFLKSNAFLIQDLLILDLIVNRFCWLIPVIRKYLKRQYFETYTFLQMSFDKSSMNWNVKLFNWKITSRHNHYSAYYVLYGTCQIVRILIRSKKKNVRSPNIASVEKNWEIFSNKMRNIFEKTAK